MEKSLNRILFDLGARLGSLEGYLYAEKQVEKKYLTGWLQNIDNQFTELPRETQDELRSDFVEVLKKVAALLERSFGAVDPDTVKCKAIVSRLGGG
ncbi:MAG: hypothetical protein GTO40_16025 [Deltaproteobacteria bacterium]|nr:hypothetical protein [Deltaproteobacteria bacterium]